MNFETDDYTLLIRKFLIEFPSDIIAQPLGGTVTLSELMFATHRYLRKNTNR